MRWNNNSSLTLTGAGTLAVSGIEGAGDLTVGAGSSLTASHIIQGALVIGGTAEIPAVVTIAASDSSGNPLTAPSASSETTTSVGVAPAASYSSRVGASAGAEVSPTIAMTPSFTSNLSRGSNLPNHSSSNRSRDAATSLLASFGGIGSMELTELADSSLNGGRPSLWDSAPSSSLSPNEFDRIGQSGPARRGFFRGLRSKRFIPATVVGR